ncbi:MarR family winged helix-turn-helix transcriptional regulator [Pseudoxanthomonas sp.]|uniref:MarR family winged helix-turn-helix transcriptional regulator n=1 Tax=Pseudoxanthomonas sp. TaxID=1871049 RepID=UPI00258C0D2B|nr:MarR family winged helix-turn-helix transcriptional regulator [Pseudoxanthomonas sp.]MCR6686587.1 MarR family winged helix-turn-helix transcriptional regulator [Pseudoxanthomonas sp.]
MSVSSSHEVPGSGPAADAGHAQLDLEYFLPYRLSVLSNRVSQTIADMYQKRFGLAITEWRVMAVLGRFPDLSANEVAERTAMDKVAVSRAVAKLLERSLIKREIHSDDRRRSVLALSEVGYTVYDEIAPMALAAEQRLIATLDEQERTTLDRLMHKLAGPGLAALRDGA